MTRETMEFQNENYLIDSMDSTAHVQLWIIWMRTNAPINCAETGEFVNENRTIVSYANRINKLTWKLDTER